MVKEQHTNLLTDDEERQLAQLIAQGNQKALDKLITANLGFVVSIASQYRGTEVPFDDLVSEGNIAMMLAAKKWDPDKCGRFVQYAVWDIRKAIEHTIDQQMSIVRDAMPVVGNTNSRVDMVVAKGNANPNHEVDMSEAGDSIMHGILRLNEREQKVIRMYYGIGDTALTMMEIAQEMNLKRERVRQIRKKAERKLRKIKFEM